MVRCCEHVLIESRPLWGTVVGKHDRVIERVVTERRKYLGLECSSLKHEQRKIYNIVRELELLGAKLTIVEPIVYGAPSTKTMGIAGGTTVAKAALSVTAKMTTLLISTITGR